MIASIETRFDDENRTILRGFGYLHPQRISQQDSFQFIKVAAEHYQSDINSDYLEQEIQLLRRSKLLLEIIAKAEVEKRKPTLLDLHRTLLSDPECFGNISKLIKIALTIPLTSASAERTFSKLKIIKNRLRSTMRQDRLQSLMIMSIESDILSNLDIESLVDGFDNYNTASRRWNLK